MLGQCANSQQLVFVERAASMTLGKTILVVRRDDWTAVPWPWRPISLLLREESPVSQENVWFSILGRVVVAEGFCLSLEIGTAS